MKICAVICEYNPFHTGHLYQLNKISKKYDDIICLMSGNFVQRAEPAIAEKSVRATVALNCGASAVIELPIIYAVANGERFASGAIKTLSRLTGIEALAMGCETEKSPRSEPKNRTILNQYYPIIWLTVTPTPPRLQKQP